MFITMAAYKMLILGGSVTKQSRVSGKSLSLETDINSLITLATIVLSMLRIARGVKIFLRNWPHRSLTCVEPDLTCIHVTCIQVTSTGTVRPTFSFGNTLPTQTACPVTERVLVSVYLRCDITPTHRV